MDERHEFTTWKSPLGKLWLSATERGVAAIHFGEPDERERRRWRRYGLPHPRPNDDAPLLLETLHQLEAYFHGERTAFDLPLDLRGTPFQMRVWEEVARIPYGQTRTYGMIAEAIGKPLAARAVGQAVGRNPIVIVIPCHRVIAANGKLGGFSSGLWRKEALLVLEGIIPPAG